MARATQVDGLAMEDPPESLVLKVGETFYTSPPSALEAAAPDGDEFRVSRESWFFKTVSYVANLYTENQGDLSKSSAQMRGYLVDQLKLSEEQYSLVDFVWKAKSQEGTFRGLRFRDVFFLSFSDAFGSPFLDSLYTWGEIPESLWNDIRNLGLFDLATDGKVTKVGMAVSQSFQRSLALDSLRKLINQHAADLTGPKLAETSPGVLIATNSSRAAAARLEWEKLHHHSVSIDKERLASDQLLTSLLDQKLKNKFSIVSLHSAGSKKLILDLASRSNPSKDSQPVVQELVNGLVVSKLGKSSSQRGLEGEVASITKYNFLNLLDVALLAMAMAKHVSWSAVLPYFMVIKSLIEKYGESHFILVKNVDFFLRTWVYDQISEDPTVVMDTLFLRLGNKNDPLYEEHFFSIQREAVASRTESVAADLANTAAMIASQGGQRNPRPVSAPPGGSGTGLGNTLGPVTPNGLMYESLLPHRGKGGCPGYFYQGLCALGPSCPKSHCCPLVSCQGAPHSFKLTHPDLSTNGNKLETPYSGNKLDSQFQGKGPKGQNKGPPKVGGKGGKTPSGKPPHLPPLKGDGKKH